MIPIRCFTCGKVIANNWNIYQDMCKQYGRCEVLDKLGYTRYCCRRMFLGEINYN